MKPSRRVLLLLVFLEIALVAFAWFLISSLRSGRMQPSGDLGVAITTITQTIGSVMGGLAGLLLVVCLILHRKERKNAVK